VKTVEELISIGDGFLDNSRHKEAIQYFDKANQLQPTSKAFELKGIAEYARLNAEQALHDLTQAITLDHQNHNAFFNRGMIWAEKQEFSKAKEDFDRASGLVPENNLYRLNLASTYLELKDYQAVIGLCDEVLEYDGANYHALIYKADALLSLKNYPEAIKYYQYILEFDPGNAYYYNNLAFSYTYTGQLQKAKINYEKAIKLLPEFAYAWDNLGYVYYLEKNHEEALKLINHSINIDASNSWAFKNRALVYLDLNEKAKAKEDLEHARELGYAQHYDNEVNHLLNTHFP
jgi:tetratricopeptide (TPR) repeat protein